MALVANNSTVVGISRAQNQNHEPVAEEGYRPSDWEAVINPRAYPFNPDEWRLKRAKEVMQQPGRDVALRTSIPSGTQNAATLGEPAKSDLFVLPGIANRLKAEESNADSALSDHTSLAVVGTTNDERDATVCEQIGKEPSGSPELRARAESENASRSSAESIEEGARNVDGDEEEGGGDSDERREVEGENEVGSGEGEQVEPALSGGIPCPRPLQEIF
jgi:hypothetical protein